jgi:GxxExxY protein
MDELLYKDEVFQLVGLCMEIHRELGKSHDEIIYKDAFVIELTRAGIPFLREKNYEITYKGSHPASLLLRGLCGLG